MRLYHSLYRRNIRQFLKSKGKTVGILGHLHTSNKEKDFAVVGTFHEGHVYEDDQVVAISDVHLGIFDYSENQFKKLKSILTRQDKKIILLGDFFDFFYMTPAKLIEKYSDLIDLIKRRQKEGSLIYLEGNHDEVVTKYLGILSAKEYSIGNKIFFHGHTCDPLYTLFPLNIFQYIRSKLGVRLHWLRPLYLKFHS